MRLTRYTDYSLRVLIYLGLKKDALATISEIAERYDISRNHIMKVVHELGKRGYIETIRGKGGGIRLRSAPSEINLGELVRAMESDFHIAECFAQSGACRIAPSCRLRGILHDALKAFLATLDAYSLADILQSEQELMQLLRMPA